MIFATESWADCTGPLGDGYDDCVAFGLNDAPRFSASAICDYREAIGMTSSWDSVAGMLTITIDPNSGDGIPAVRHPLHDGEWAKLTDYLDAFYGLALGEGCADDVNLPRPNECGPFPFQFVITDTPVWIDSNGISQYQDLNPFWGALASPEGIIDIQDTAIYDLISSQLNQCDTKSVSAGGDTFEVRQCSYYTEAERVELTEGVCEPNKPHFISWHNASTRYEYFKWNTLQTNFDYTSGTGVFRRLLIKADSARLENAYFTSYGGYVDSHIEIKHDTPPFGISRDRRMGVCGDSRVEKGGPGAVYPQTFTGSAPNCFR